MENNQTLASDPQDPPESPAPRLFEIKIKGCGPRTFIAKGFYVEDGTLTLVSDPREAYKKTGMAKVATVAAGEWGWCREIRAGDPDPVIY